MQGRVGSYCMQKRKPRKRRSSTLLADYWSNGRLRTRAASPAADRYVYPHFPACIPTNSCVGYLYCPSHRTELSRNPPDGISVGLADDDNIYKWEVMIMGPQDTMYEGGFFKARLDFPPDFPNSPPIMQFISQMWHPNIHEDGKVCISILHPPGEDAFNAQESAEERWRPILGVEAILVSVISMLSAPNNDSPANVDAGVQFREDPAAFKRQVQRTVRRSQEEC